MQNFLLYFLLKSAISKGPEFNMHIYIGFLPVWQIIRQSWNS